MAKALCTNNVQLYIVEDFKERRTKDSSFFVGKCIIKDGSTISAVVVPHGMKTMAEAMKKGQYVLVTQTDRSANGDLRVTSKSKLFHNAARFVFDFGIVTEYESPPVVSIGDVWSSPVKRRISIEGTVSKSGSLEDGGHYKRRRIVVTDEMDRSIEVKLWNEKATGQELKENDKVIVKCVEVGKWHSVTSLNSTAETTVTVRQVEKEDIKVETLNVLAVNEREVVIDDGRILVQGDDCAVEPGVVTVSLQGTKIVRIEEDLLGDLE